jgi:hypothetical protein
MREERAVMGGRTMREDRRSPDREQWIREVSDARLHRYEKLMMSQAAPYRLDGAKRVDQGGYFRDLLNKEINRRKGK